MRLCACGWMLVLITIVFPVSAAGQDAGAPVEEDELAPVRAIQERLRERLGLPAERLDVDLIMEGSDFTGTRPGGLRWDGDGRTLWFEWKRWDEEESGTWELDVESGELRRLEPDEADRVPAAFAVRTRDGDRVAWSDGQRVLIREQGETRTLIEGVNGRPVAFSGDEERLVVRSGNDLVAYRLGFGGEGAAIRQLTDIRSGSEPSEGRDTDSQRWLREQQLALFDVLARRQERREEQERRRGESAPEPFWLEGLSVSNLVPSPDLEWVAIFLRRDATEDRVADVPNYVTESGYTEDIRTRIKVGDVLDGQRLTLLHVASGAAVPIEPGLEDREVGFQGGAWSEDSGRLLVQLRAADNKDRWLGVVEPAWTEPEAEGDASDDDAEAELSPEITLAFHDEDEAWINWSVAGGWGWLPDGESFYLVSERDGWMHLYRVPAGGGEPEQLTSGEFEVSGPRLHPERDSFVFEASIVDPFEVHAYRLPLDGGEPAQLTEGHGNEQLTLSPDGSARAIVASDAARPWELWVQDGDGAPRRVTESPSPAFASYPWVEPEIVHFEARDGVDVPARLYRPEEPHPDAPAVIFVHGAGYLHNVHRWWSSYSREYTFHHLLMERGFTVLDIDYRGSAGYGRDWRTAIYRHMGGLDLTDQVDGARYLVEDHGIDPERIGLYGGSYGGFITLMALFTEADSFASGAALRPVTDWAHYNHPYTSNILNEPQEDSEAYWRSSPIYFAEGLEDPLLIAHGMVDTNVHFQGVVRLAQRLIELRKEDWEVAMYPIENHGFVEPASWADEYRRILKLFERTLLER